MSTMININDLPQRLSQVLSDAAKGEEIIVTRDDVPVAKLVPLEAAVPAAPKERIAGLGQGRIWISPDFDEPLPDEFWMGES